MEGGAICGFCGTLYAEPLTLCPRCQYVNSREADFCLKCGTELTVTCPACGSANWAGAEHCTACGRDLDALQHAFRSFQDSYQSHIEQDRAELPELRLQEEQESDQRMEKLEEIDRQRLLNEALRAAQAKRRERLIIVVMSAVTIVFFAILVALLGPGLV
jgi:hypothetical protein